MYCEIHFINHLDTPGSRGGVRQQRWIFPFVSAPQKRNTKTQPTPAVVIHLSLIYRDSLEKNHKTYPGDFHTVLDVIFSVLTQFWNKALICIFSCVYLPLLQPAQNKEILNTYWLRMPINLSFSHFYDVSDGLCLFSIYCRLFWINFICWWYFHNCSIKTEI